MNRNIIIAFLGVALLIGLLLFFMDGDQGLKPGQKPKNYYSNWDQSYTVNNPNPRNISFFIDLLQEYTEDTVLVATSWKKFDSLPDKDSATYLYIGSNMGMSTEHYEEIMTYADSGAMVFFAFDYVTSNIYEEHFEPGAYFWDYSKNLYAWIGDTSLKYSYVYQNDTLFTDWYFFDEWSIKDTNYVSYAFAMDKPIAFYEKHGSGSVHFHSIPRLFENYQVLSPNGYAHAMFMLKRIPKNKPVILLKCADYIQEYENPYENNQDGNGNSKQDTSYIQYILKNPSLRLAFILGLVLGILYLIFRAKRRENVLEGYPEKQNMGLAFVETLSSIYISRNSPIGILQVIRKNFYSAVNRHFYVDLNRKEEREIQFQRLLERSNYDPEKLREIINGLQSKGNNVDYHYLGELYRKIRAFYMETGILHETRQFVATDKQVRIERSVVLGGSILLVGLFVLTRGLFLLTLGGGVGMLMVIPAIVIIYAASRILRLPVAEIKQEKIVLYGLLFGKKEISLKQTIHTQVDSNRIQFHAEDGSQFEIKTGLLSKNAKTTLSNFVEYLKNHTS